MNANRNVERGQVTRAHIIDVAMRLFAAHGFDGTSIEAVLAESGVSRGSLYHHFAGKDVLFLAVLETVGARLAEQTAVALQDARDPVDVLRIGGVQWLRQASDPVVRQIMLIDAPAVLGWRRWREMDEQSTLGVIRSAIAYSADQGAVDQRHVDVFAHIVLAAANETAMMIALASDSAAAAREAESALVEFLDRLLGAPGSGS
ncbi:MAG TPA: TetR/AcrR family transcriptional regulator [Streptosporangiaceae bacterium]|jgi:AcrR family transcriptional regulator